MPNVKQGGGYTLTFAKKNQDVKELLDKKKEAGIVVTEYICKAVRFYEQYKDSVGTETLSINMIEELVNKKMESFKKEFLNSNLSVNEETSVDKKVDNYLEEFTVKIQNKINTDDD